MKNFGPFDGSRGGMHGPWLALLIMALSSPLAAMPIAIGTVEDLQRIGNDPDFPSDGHYVLSAHIDASATETWNDGAGFAPLPEFSGVLDGQGHVISNLHIDRRGEHPMGLFGFVLEGGVVKRLALAEATVLGGRRVGGLAGINAGTISDSEFSGTVAAHRYSSSAGGVAGINNGLLVKCRVSSASHISGGNVVGGLVGRNHGPVHLCQSHATVVAEDLEGWGDLQGAGGLAGYTTQSISKSFATGPVASTFAAGGLVAEVAAWETAVVSQCYATGPVTGGLLAGGLVGILSAGFVAESYATGSVTGYGGGLIHYEHHGSTTYSFWDVETTGMEISDAGTGLTTAQMKQSASYGPYWDFEGTWAIVAGESYPYIVENPQNPPPGMSSSEALFSHSADQRRNGIISLSDLLRVIQLYNVDGFHCASTPDKSEDGFILGADPSAQDCTPHSSDYNPQDWNIGLSELMRAVSFYNIGAYHACPDRATPTEDGFCPGPPTGSS